MPPADIDAWGDTRTPAADRTILVRVTRAGTRHVYQPVPGCHAEFLLAAQRETRQSDPAVP